MKTFFESSAVVAALWSSHPEHLKCRTLLMDGKAGAYPVAISQLSLHEAYAVLTTLPVAPAFSVSVVSTALKSLLQGVTVVSLGPDAYQACVERAERLGAKGWAVTDLMHIRAAEVWGAQRFVTVSSSDWQLLSKDSNFELA
jgi:predicted nucleic acid-binding protein